MRYIDVCSGISAPTMERACTKCGEVRPLPDGFHSHPGGPLGRHSWCKECVNAAQRGVRKRKDTTENRRERLLKQRYGMTSECKAALLREQGGVCAICLSFPAKPVIDHDHATGRVRGILCHGCNIKLPAIEDGPFLTSALEYLGRTK